MLEQSYSRMAQLPHAPSAIFPALFVAHPSTSTTGQHAVTRAAPSRPRWMLRRSPVGLSSEGTHASCASRVPGQGMQRWFHDRHWNRGVSQVHHPVAKDVSSGEIYLSLTRRAREGRWWLGWWLRWQIFRVSGYQDRDSSITTRSREGGRWQRQQPGGSGGLVSGGRWPVAGGDGGTAGAEGRNEGGENR